MSICSLLVRYVYRQAATLFLFTNLFLRFSVVGEASQRMLDAKMNAINDRLNRLAEKYEQIKQLEEQMKESNQILDLLLERR